MRLKLTAKTIKRILQAYYCEPKISQYVFLDEVQMSNGTIADGILVECWGDNMRTGFEIKIARSDFRKEIKQPMKRQRIMDFTNQFYFVAPERMLNKDEIPEDCGLIEISLHSGNYRYMEGYKLRIKKKAPWTRAEDLKGVWENMLRKAWGYMKYTFVQAEIIKYRREAAEADKRNLSYKRRNYRLEKLVKKYKERLDIHTVK